MLKLHAQIYDQNYTILFRLMLQTLLLYDNKNQVEALLMKLSKTIFQSRFNNACAVRSQPSLQCIKTELRLKAISVTTLLAPSKIV